MIEENRARALKLALEYIDRHVGEFEDKEEQNAMLARLIERHELKSQSNKHARGVAKKERNLTVDIYRKELGNMASRQGIRIKERQAGIVDVLTKGSAVITAKYLAKLGHTEQLGEADSDDEDEENEIVVAGALADTETSPSEAETIRHEIANSTGTSSQAEPKDGEKGGNGKVLPRPTPSPLSSRSEFEAESRKRKLSTEHDSSSRPSTAPKLDAANTVDLNSSSAAQSDTSVVIEKAGAKQASEGVRAGPGRESDTPSHAVLSAATCNTARGLVRLSDDTIIRDLDAIWTDIQSVTRKLLNGLRDRNGGGEWDLRPNSEMTLLYQRIFGADWKKRARPIHLAGVSFRNLIELIIAAGAYNLILDADLPWQGPGQILASFSQHERHINLVLRETDPMLRMHTIVWQASRVKLDDEEFRKDTVQPHADAQAEYFMLMAANFFRKIGNKKPDDAFWDTRTGEISEAFSKALILRGQMDAAPDYYRRTWIESGAIVDGSKMVELHPGEGEQEVTGAVTPLIEKRATKDAEWKVACLAKVFSRPRKR